MNRHEFKESLFGLLDKCVEEHSIQDMMHLLEELIIDYQKENEKERNTSNKGKPWTDEELEIILMSAPIKSNCMKYARLFRRGYGSVEQIYRWASTSDKEIKEKRPDDAFIWQIKRVAKRIGYRG